MVKDVDEAQFEQEVIERSRKLPVLVDFWAEWCGPCRTLGPALEQAVTGRGGAVELVKVDVDRNQSLAASFGIRGIPAVKAFRDGRVVDEFTGAIPPERIESFLEGLLPSPAEELAGAGDEESLRRALELDPAHAGAATGLARMLLERGERVEARTLLERFPDDFVAAGLLARAELEGADAEPNANGDLAAAWEAWDGDQPERALERLQEAIAAESDEERRDLIRRAMVAIFTELGPGHPVAGEHRRRLAAVLN